MLELFPLAPSVTISDDAACLFPRHKKTKWPSRAASNEEWRY
jgi:hypothetical protein